jgi:two-component system response regulator GlrR
MRKRDQRRKLDAAVKAMAATSRPDSSVLVVEADPDLQWALARMLTVDGNRVVGTSSGDGALALLAEWKMDLVLVDEDLPGRSGLQLARDIRASYPGVPVILMTATPTDDMQSAARLAGAVAALRKPFKIEALTEVLESLRGSIAPPPAPAE